MTITRHDGREPAGGAPDDTRRAFLVASGALGVAGCGTTPKCCPLPAPPTRQMDTALIDGHCHLFNAKDLSIVRFLSYVVAKHYPEQANLRALRPEDPDFVDRVMQVVLALAGAGSAPTAANELALLQGRPVRAAPGEAAEPQDDRAVTDEIVERMTAFLGGKSYLRGPASKEQRAAEDAVRALIVESAGGEVSALAAGEVAKLSTEARREIVRRALAAEAPVRLADAASGLGGIYLPGLIEFVKQLKGFRHCLVDELTRLHRQGAGQNPQLMVPAMVDFGRWLRDDPAAGSTFAQQAQVWREIARRPGGPAVHGYVAFCPLRQVEYERGRFGSGPGQIKTACDAEPLAVVRDALLNQGFIGVKVYPPMGFRAATNAKRGPDEHPFPKAVLKDVFGRTTGDNAARSRELGKALDDAMDRLFVLCRKLGAPIMAHGGNSVGANCDTGELADPFYWKPVFDRSNAPPVMLAHFGGFNYWSADPNAPGRVAALGKRCQARDEPAPFENTWEYWLASYIQKNPGKPIFADMSFFSEALTEDGEETALRNFQALERAGLTAIKDHLVFGTDWVMLAQVKNAGVYSKRVRDFIKRAFGDDYVEPIMRTNFLRYAGLMKGEAGFDRIAKVYEGDATLIARLEAARA